MSTNIPILYRRGNRGPERLSPLPEETQLARAEPGLDPYVLACVLRYCLLLLDSGDACNDPREGREPKTCSWLVAERRLKSRSVGPHAGALPSVPPGSTWRLDGGRGRPWTSTALPGMAEADTTRCLTAPPGCLFTLRLLPLTRSVEWVSQSPSLPPCSAQSVSALLETRPHLHHLGFLVRDRGDLVDYGQSISERKITAPECPRQRATALERPTPCHCACSTRCVPPVTDGVTPWDRGAWMKSAPELGGCPREVLGRGSLEDRVSKGALSDGGGGEREGVGGREAKEKGKGGRGEGVRGKGYFGSMGSLS